MDRNIVYPGSIPQDIDILNPNRNTMLALGFLIQATLGTGTVVDGLACSPANGLAVSVGAGSLTQLSTVDATDYGSLAADTSDALVKMGINISATTLDLAAPALPGEAVNYLIEANFSESDASPVVLPFVNAANPSQPFTGPNNTGATTNSARIQRVNLVATAGSAAAAGAQGTPSPDTGYVGLYVVTVTAGQTQIIQSNIATYPDAPFLAFKLPQLAPGVSRMAVLTSSGSWTVPNQVSLLKVRLWGGGGAGGNGGGTGYVGGGGAGGAYVEGFFDVSPGSVLGVTLGAGGEVSINSGRGGDTALGTLATAGGGGGGGAGSAGGVGLGSIYPGSWALGSAVFGNAYVTDGLGGQNGIVAGSTLISGQGGGANGGCGALSAAGDGSTNVSGLTANAPGAGGSGGIASGSGGTGSPGQIIIEW